jgi:hypothetical protein
MMHLFLAAIKRKVPSQLTGVSSGAQHRGRLFILCTERERDAPQFLPEVLAAKSLRPRGIWW